MNQDLPISAMFLVPSEQTQMRPNIYYDLFPSHVRGMGLGNNGFIVFKSSISKFAMSLANLHQEITHDLLILS